MISPLSGKRVLVTRARGQAATFSRLVEKRGGVSVEIPLIAFKPRLHALNTIDISQYEWVVFTSSNGVRYFFQEASLPRNIKVAAVGSKTAKALKQHHVTIDLLPEDYTAEGLISALSQSVEAGESVLLPRGNLSRKVLPKQLMKLGLTVKDLTIYDTVIPYDSEKELTDLITNKKIDVITFTSSSTVHHFVELLKVNDLKESLKGITIAVIGPITDNTLQSYGLKADVVPKEYTIEGLLQSLEHYFLE
ncbi:uroporphyrinogen-III synthase [Guptibacillus algicola]|uniref:uroporphyrinogen-III synthase n=1 Tax=Guptibacillus algicola TaxID=225844 RepID=UPI001CD3DEA6|nr:uroporphyrinogen-III synthase [Alkalihalobacillus algicola]MCA0986242.1 uroporphyrinogen-III synthase [Alkalihalobacillus algicola]